MPNHNKLSSPLHTNSIEWATTATGLVFPHGSMPLIRNPSYSEDIFLPFWKPVLDSSVLYNETPDIAKADRIISVYNPRFLLNLLSKTIMRLELSTFNERLKTQSEIAPLFFSLDARNRADQWIKEKAAKIGGYVFSEQQLLRAEIMAILKGKKRFRRYLTSPPLDQIGKALAHIAGLSDPFSLKVEDKVTPEKERKELIGFILRNGAFYEGEDYVYAISRYYELLCSVSSKLHNHPDFIDLSSEFHKITKLKLESFYGMGAAFLEYIQQAAKADSGSVFDINKFAPSRGSRKLCRRFLSLISVKKAGFRREHQLALKTFPAPHYNFLAVEAHPVVNIGKKYSCCLSLKMLQRKLSIGPLHTVSTALMDGPSRKYRSFIGAVFEVYVKELCQRAFSSLFVCDIRYGNNEEGGDCWILYPPNAVLIEAKSGYLLLETVLSGDFAGFERSFKQTLLKGTSQLNRVINDFRAKRFEVGGFGPDTIKRIYPVIVSLRYFPLDKFLADYIDAAIKACDLLTQSNVEPLTIMPVKDLERIEAHGGMFLDLVQERLKSSAWRQTSFSNFLANKYGPGTAARNIHLVTQYQNLLNRTSRQLFNRNIGPQLTAPL